jgi:hypothetical chaperone protein
MIAGFDYGSSNCAIGVMNAEQQIGLVPLYKDQCFLPSTLYALSRDLICEGVARQIDDPTVREEYLKARANQLRLASSTRLSLGLLPHEQTLFVGEEAIENYIDLPEEGYFIKSPKSFLGVSGLQTAHLAFFEDIVTAMMFQIKQAAEARLQDTINHTVIGRPVNFQGSGGEAANQQACGILQRAAKNAGFKSVELLYEPLAGGIDYEARLDTNKTVLVVDVGGGTTDCSVVKMGPDYRNKPDRQADFLGHSGARIGGNDLDINLAYRGLMPVLGMGGELKNGLPLPSQPYWNAVSINDIPSQVEFNSLQNIELMQQMKRDAVEPEKLALLLKLQLQKQNYQLVRSAELAKITLSSDEEHRVNLEYLDQDLIHTVSRELYENAIERPVAKITALMDDVLRQAQCRPDLVYVTGGTTKSPAVRQAIASMLGDIEVVDGDYFGSVTAGLTRWAEKIYG